MPSRKVIESRKAAGLCSGCGKVRDRPDRKCCESCRRQSRKRMRKRGGYRPQVQGGRGRPTTDDEGIGCINSV
jgi:predicted amidophosphoribosyltransferase